MNAIKAIETQYKGYRFRSRLEARWAVFFDALGFDWAYEAEGFYFGHESHYLPDFILRYHDERQTGMLERLIHIEQNLRETYLWAKNESPGTFLKLIGGQSIDDFVAQHMKPRDFAFIEIKPVFPDMSYLGQLRDLCDYSRHHVLLIVGVPGEHQLYDFIYTANGGAWPLPPVCPGDVVWTGFNGDMPSDTVLKHAINRARSARFEFGEHGR